MTLPTIDQIALRLAALAAAEPVGARIINGLMPAAVLIPLVVREGEVEVLLTQRAEHLPHHPGQISFPGGGLDLSDASLQYTALRETYEEIGIDPQWVNIIARLADVPTISGFNVTPFVGVVADGFQVVSNPNEVAQVFSVPLVYLWHSENWRQETLSHSERNFLSHVVQYNEHRIWGATAAIMRNFIQALK